MTLIMRARILADAAHGELDHRRKYTGDPYIVHLAEVANLLASFGFNPNVVAAGWLHDVLEDTRVTAAQITREFGPVVSRLVVGVTDISSPDDGNRAARKRIDRAHLAQQCFGCKAIKLCDVISNTKSIVEHDPDFARVYLPEKLSLLTEIRQSHEVLWHMAFDTVSEGIRALGLTARI